MEREDREGEWRGRVHIMKDRSKGLTHLTDKESVGRQCWYHWCDTLPPSVHLS